MSLCLPLTSAAIIFAAINLPMRQGLLYIVVFILFSSCSGIKNLFQPAPAPQQTTSNQSLFIEDITIKPDGTPVNTKSATAGSPVFVNKQVGGYTSPLEMYTISQFKYAIQLNVPVETLSNTSLYQIIDDWWNTPYRFGGTTKKGIDCSAFVQTLMMSVFAIQLPRTAREQRAMSTTIASEELREGDLVFFNTRGGISHVGVFLHNNKFVHASTSSGVMISDLNEEYWRRKFISAGRIIQTILPKP